LAKGTQRRGATAAPAGLLLQAHWLGWTQIPLDMMEPKQYREWLRLRERLLQQEREFARGQQAIARGEPMDLQELSIQQSEIRALRALSKAIIRRSLQPHDRSERPGGD